MRYTDDTRAVEWYNCAPPRGGHVQLVRWFMGEHGPEYELVTGKWLGVSDGVWQVEIGDRVESFPRDVWQVCRA
jgi:hypothetical protein